jgi:hypothetical protein
MTAEEITSGVLFSNHSFATRSERTSFTPIELLRLEHGPAYFDGKPGDEWAEEEKSAGMLPGIRELSTLLPIQAAWGQEGGSRPVEVFAVPAASPAARKPRGDESQPPPIPAYRPHFHFGNAQKRYLPPH